MVAQPELILPAELVAADSDGTGRGNDTWEVLTAARDGDVARLGVLLDRNRTLANAAYWYATPLQFAVREGRLAAVELLIDAGADIFHCSLYGQETLLQMALDRGHLDVADRVRAELRRRASSDGTRHPIHDAVAAADLAVVDRLLAVDASLVDRGDPLGRRPLHHAVESGRADLVDALIARGADVDATGFSSDDRLGGSGFRPITIALWHHPYWRQRNDYDLARRLLAHGASHSITIAAALGNADHVGALLRTDAGLANDQDPGGKRPLSAAAERNHGAIVALLLDAGADPNLPEGPHCPRGYALWAGSHFGYREVTQRLLDAGADPNAEVDSSGSPTGAAADAGMRALMYRYGGRAPLAWHFHEGHIDTIAALLDARPEMIDETRTAEGFTLAVSAGHDDLVRLMLARGLRVPAVVTSCQTYLWRSLPLARLLLEHGMDPSLPNWQRMTPLHHIAGRGDVDAARLFLEFGADPDAVDEEYRSTPLGWAARCGQAEFVRFALAHGFDPALPESPAWARPAAWAQRRGHRDVIELLA